MLYFLLHTRTQCQLLSYESLWVYWVYLLHLWPDHISSTVFIPPSVSQSWLLSHDNLHGSLPSFPSSDFLSSSVTSNTYTANTQPAATDMASAYKACLWLEVVFRPGACGPGRVVTWVQLQSRVAISSARRPPAPSKSSLRFLFSHTPPMKPSSVSGETSQDTEPQGNHYDVIQSEGKRQRERFHRKNEILRMILIIKHIQLCLYFAAGV